MTQSVKTLIDHINEICVNKSEDYFKNMSEEDKKSYNIFVINRILSMTVDYAPFINEIQSCELSPENHYRIVSGILPKRKQYKKYIKSESTVKYPDWMIDIVSQHYSVSKKESREYIDIYYRFNKNELRSICRAYGIEPKLLKKENL